MHNFVLFIHIIAATAWVGGGLMLFGIGLYFRDKEVQKTIYFYIGPFYGYFQWIWISILVITGIMLLGYNDLLSLIFTSEFNETELGYLLHIKALFVLAIILSAGLHTYISLKAHARERSIKEKFISRATSLGIFLANFIIIYIAMIISTTIL